MAASLTLVVVGTVTVILRRDSSHSSPVNQPLTQTQKEEAGGQQFDQDQQRIINDYPLMSKLPFALRYASISYGASAKYPNDKNKMAVIIRADTPAGRLQGLSYIRYVGYDPTDYEIIFPGSTNPFVKVEGEEQ